MATLSAEYLIARAGEVIEREAQGVKALSGQIDKGLVDVIQRLLNCQGHVLVAGAGTSHAVAQRFAHLLSCSGTPALCVNAADCLHGGAGAITDTDVVFECPFCGKYAATLKDVKEKYGALVRVVFKQFPLPFHENAFGKALVTFAAQKYGQFWYMHDLIFGLGPDLTEAQFKEKLGEWGTDLDSFMTLAQSQELIDRVDADMAQAQELGVNGTPYSFVNGVLLSGAQPPEPVEAAVEAALGRAYVLLAQGVKPEDVYSKLIESGK